MITTTVEGFDELERKLRTMPDVLRGRRLQGAVEDGAEVLVEFMQALAPRGEGNPHAYRFIAANLSGENRSPDEAQYDVGPTGAGFYLTFHETGTIYMAPSPFMRPAMEAGRTAVIQAVRDHLLTGIRLVARS